MLASLNQRREVHKCGVDAAERPEPCHTGRARQFLNTSRSTVQLLPPDDLTPASGASAEIEQCLRVRRPELSSLFFFFGFLVLPSGLCCIRCLRQQVQPRKKSMRAAENAPSAYAASADGSRFSNVSTSAIARMIRA